jgi:transposase
LVSLSLIASIYPTELAKWCPGTTAALCDPQNARASPQATRKDRMHIKELERELLRKDRALAETAALLVLSKK